MESDLADIWDNEQSETQLDAYNRLTRQNTMTIEQHSSPSPKRGGHNTKENNSDNVPLCQHYRKVYNQYINSRFHQPDPVSDDDEEEEDEEESTSKKRKRKEYDIMTRDECFLCAWGNTYHDGIEAPHINKLTEIIKNNYGIHSKYEIAQELHLYFMKEIYDPLSDMRILTREIALDHIENHTKDARIFLGEAIEEEKQLLFSFKNAIWKEDGSFDKNAVAEYRRSKKELRELYLMPLSKMNFNNGNNADDLKREANYFNLMPKFETKCKKKKVNHSDVII
jgi:hypothetical protein